jgi:hypothetical protein
MTPRDVGAHGHTGYRGHGEWIFLCATGSAESGMFIAFFGTFMHSRLEQTFRFFSDQII